MNHINKTKKINYINHFSETIITKNNNFHQYKEDFLSSCFKYYYGNIQICDNKINLYVRDSNGINFVCDMKEAHESDINCLRYFKLILLSIII